MKRGAALAWLLLASFARTARAAQESDDESPRRPARWAVGFNPLAMAIGRYSFDVERQLAPHHVLVLNVHGDYASADWPAMQYDGAPAFWGFGGEIGERWFPQSTTLDGAYLGVSLLAERFSASYYGSRLALPAAGFAADFGFQRAVGGGFFAGAGLGLQHTWTPAYPKDIAPAVTVLGAKMEEWDGWNPRFLLTFGVLLR